MTTQQTQQDQGENAPIYFEETVVKVNRCAKVVKGGRRFSFSALVVIGNRAGAVGVGFGKAKEVPSAVTKGVKSARKDLRRIPLNGTTIPHPIIGRYGAARVKLIPAAPGTGIIAGASARAVLEYAGVTDVLTKSMGSHNPINLVKATMDGLKRLRSRDEVERRRGVKFA